MSGKDITTAVQNTAVKAEKETESIMDRIAEGDTPESTNTNLRYAAYGSRLRTMMVAASRYVAYTSDIGESFRPVAHPYWIRSAYAVSWIYLAGDVSNETYKAYLKNQEMLHKPPPSQTPNSAESFAKAKATDNPDSVPLLQDYRLVGVQRAVFQTLASMALPAFTIHSTVKYAGKAMKDVQNVKLRTWGPIGLGLAVVPALPFIFDQPVEHAVEYVFEKGTDAWETSRAKAKIAKEKKDL